MSNFLISEALADNTATPAPQAANQANFTSFIPLILVFLIFYFLLIRPQQKKIKEHQHTLSNLKKGDKIYTNGGVFGVVKAIDDKESLVDLEISDNVTIKILKHNISSVIQNKSEKPKSKK